MVREVWKKVRMICFEDLQSVLSFDFIDMEKEKKRYKDAKEI